MPRAKKEPKEIASKEKKKMGRPTIYSLPLAEKICELISTSSVGLKRICEENDDIPDAATIKRWCREKTDFCALYAQAKRDQADLMVDEIMLIADDGQNDWMEKLGEDAPIGWQLNGEHVARSRLRIDTRKWVASKLYPKVYGANAAEDKKSENSSVIEQLIDKINNK